MEPDAPPTNRASYNSNQVEDRTENPSDCRDYFQPLRWGVDTLYLSYHGSIHNTVDNELKDLKALAQSQDDQELARAQYEINDHIFEVKDKGAGRFPYILEDKSFRLQIARKLLLPLLYGRVSSYFLAHASPRQAEASLRSIATHLGQVEPDESTSRIDLYVDFVSSVRMDGWTREAWVTRASAIDNYSRDQKFTGWAIGAGGNMIARLYNKTEEIKKSGKTYLFELWKAQGWDGESDVWRLEFEFKREILSQFRLSTLDSVLKNLNGLWSYATTEWLKLTEPNPDDKTRSRWPIHPLWAYLSTIDWETDGGVLLRKFNHQRTPSDEYLFGHMQGLLTSFMAKSGVVDLDAWLDEYKHCEGWRAGKETLWPNIKKDSTKGLTLGTGGSMQPSRTANEYARVLGLKTGSKRKRI
ncbi:replication initiation factor [Methylovorus sp. MM2]|uniref:replication initiation factor n=1 Tax=Methylovorus sp. MM2 TaxID=1848038 RepID=UPI0020B79390|nr:replication initiation factor [Methylovorus sp. MM2]